MTRKDKDGHETYEPAELVTITTDGEQSRFKAGFRDHDGQFVEYVPLTIEDAKPYLRHIADLPLREIGKIGKMTYMKPYDYIYKNHIDTRDLIEKGLAIRVTEDNNPYTK